MSIFVKFSVNTILYSIVNPENILTFLDSDTPYSFNDFLKYTNENYSPTNYNDFYLFYLSTWHNIKNIKVSTQQDFITSQYISLLKDITLNYTTNDEKRFLSNIDYTNSDNLEIIIPFYSNKIKDIILFFKTKRNTTSYQYKEFKRKGTVGGIETTLRNNLLDFIFANQQSITSNLDYNSIKNILEIEVEDLVDTFGEYLNLNETPILTETASRNQFYTSNFNKIDTDVFLNFNGALMKNIFNNVFLKQLGVNFKVNVNLSYDTYCSPDNPLGNLIKQKTIGGVSPTDKILLQQKLIEKYIGVDLYYLTKTSTGEILSGTLVQSRNPSGNLLNTTNPSTATIPSYELTALKKIGLYFRPDNVGVLRFDTRKKTHYIDSSAVESGVVYVFPDPEIYSNVQYTTSNPLVFTIDYRVDVKGNSSTFSFGDPKVETKDQAYYGYFTRQQQKNSYLSNSVDPDFFSIANYGYIADWKTDVYGNQYALYKPGYLRNIQLPNTISPTSINNSNITQFNSNISQFNALANSSTTYSSTQANNSFTNIYIKQQYTGNILVRNVINSTISPLSTALYYTFSKYLTSIQNEVFSSVKSFELIYDTLAVETPNYFVIDKINFDDSGFTKSTQVNTYVSINSAAPFEKISNRILINLQNKLYFVVTRLYSTFPTDYSKIVYPEIYTYDILTKNLEKIFPKKLTDVEEYVDIFSHSILSNNTDLINSYINLTELHSPTISYNSYNNCFSICYTCTDMNDSPYIFNHTFDIVNNTISFRKSKLYFTNNSNLATIANTGTYGYFKQTANFYSISSREAIVIPPTTLSPNYRTVDLFDFNSGYTTIATINNKEGYLQL